MEYEKVAKDELRKTSYKSIELCSKKHSKVGKRKVPLTLRHAKEFQPKKSAGCDCVVPQCP